MKNISSNTKLEIAVEIIANKIANYSKKGFELKNQDMIRLLQERNEMYKGNEIIINKIIKDYGMKNKQ